MSQPDQPPVQQRPFRYKVGIETTAKGERRPYVEIHSDDLEQTKKEFTELWEFVLTKVKGPEIERSTL